MMETVLSLFFGVLSYFCIGSMVESLLDEAGCLEEPSALRIIFWPLVVLLLIALSLVCLFAEAGREIGERINRWRQSKCD